MPESSLQSLGRYTLHAELGRGGFATVYRATDSALEREVALKVLKPGWTDDAKAVERFMREARQASKLKHPNIVTIFDVGQAEGRLFIAMELVPGRSLQRIIAEDGALAWSRVVAMLEQTAAALDYAHKQGLIHRDIKPANIILDETGSTVHVMLTDFGLVRGAEQASLSTGTTGGLIGTSEYIAPEIWNGEPATKATDIYALGCVAYYLLTGQVLFSATTPMAVLKRHVEGPVFPQQWPSGVPDGVEAVLRRALAKEPNQRPASALELVAELRECEGQEAREPEARRKQQAEAERVAQAVSAAHRARQVDEERTRQEAERRAKEEAERKAREEQEQQRQAELAAQAAAAEKAKREAEEKAKREATVLITAREEARTASAKSKRKIWVLSGLAAVVALVIIGVLIANGGYFAVSFVTQTPAAPSTQPAPTPAPTTPIAAAPPTATQGRATATATATSTQTPTPRPTTTFTPTPANTSTPTPTPAATVTAVPTSTRAPTPTATREPSPTESLQATGSPGLITSFESFGSWKIGDQPNGTFTQSSANSTSGCCSGQLHYDFTTPGNDFVVFSAARPIPIGGQPTGISAHVYGDGTNDYINIWIIDAEGDAWQIPLGDVDGPQWVTRIGKLDAPHDWPFQKLGFNYDARPPGDDAITYPIRFYAIVLDDPDDSFVGSGDIFIDDIVALP